MTTLLAVPLPRPVRTLACSFVVYGTPIPQGSKVPLLSATVKGRPMLKDDNERVLKPWRALVDAAGRRAMLDGGRIRPPFDGPLAVRMTFTFDKPPSYPKIRRCWPATRPDGDKLARACADALTTARVWVDDGRCIDWHIRKVFAGEDPEALNVPGVRVAVWTLHEPAPVTLDGAM